MSATRCQVVLSSSEACGVDFPHPRSYTLKTSPGFMDIKARLTEEIRMEAMAAAH